MTRKQAEETSKSHFFALIFLGLAFFLPIATPAKTLVLIHGYKADESSWRSTGVTQGLLSAGWKDGGSYAFSWRGMITPRYPNGATDAFFTVNLPSQVSIEQQTNVLGHYLEHLYALRNEPIIFVGHSAGGIVARFYLVRLGHVPALSLITISTPHLGTPVANLALLTKNSPVGALLDMMGQKQMVISSGLYTDLKTAKPNSFLYWLNQQRHPNIPYVSVIRLNKTKIGLNVVDFIVPTESQDMNNVPVLRGRSKVYFTQENHFLSANDGIFLVDILNHLYKK